MAKYVYQVNDKNNQRLPQLITTGDWQVRAVTFGRELQTELEKRYGLTTQVFPDEDGVELDEGCMGMGKDWFNFRFRVFAQMAVYLDMLNVPMEWRDKRVGYYIVEMLKDFCLANHLRYIFLGSYDGANPFWEKCGFKMITEYPDFVLGYDFSSK